MKQPTIILQSGVPSHIDRRMKKIYNITKMNWDDNGKINIIEIDWYGKGVTGALMIPCNVDKSLFRFINNENVTGSIVKKNCKQRD